MFRSRLLLVIFMAGFVLATGCDKGDKPKGSNKPAPANAHPEVGPHDGALIEWGDEEYHLEFKVDHKTQEATVYVLDETAKKTKPIKSKELTLTLKQKPPVTIKLTPKPDKDDPAGSSSRFVGKHEVLGKEQEFEGSVAGDVEGKPYVGDFKEKEHKH